MIFDGDDYYTFTSGRRLYSNCGILGLGPDVTQGVFEGYDGWFEEEPFTKEEREELAAEMIQRWTQWKELA